MQKFLILLAIIFLFVSANTAFAKRAPSYIDIPKGETWEFFSDPFLRFLSSDPDIIRIRKISKDKFSIRGISIGSAYVYLWSHDDNLKTIKVTVSKPKMPPQEENEKAQGQIKPTDSLKFNYTGSSYSGGSRSQYPSNIWNYSGSFNQIDFSGKMPFGKTSSIIQYEDYKGSKGLTYLKMETSDDKYYLNVGDSSASFSEIVLPYINYQGVYLRSSPLKNVELTLLGGSRGNSYWGKNVRNDTRPQQPFTGIKALYKPAGNIELNAAFVSSSLEASASQASIASLGAKYRIFNDLLLSLDGASSSLGHKAYSLETSYSGQNTYLKGIYRNVSKDFQLPYDVISLRGVEGFYISGSYHPFSFVEVNGQIDRYKNSYLQSNNIYNKDLRGDIRFRLGQRSVFSYSPWKQDHTGLLSGGMGEGSSSQLSYGFELLGLDTIYARYEPIKFSDSRTNEANFLEDKIIFGTRFDFTPALSLNLENESKAKTKTFSNTAENANVLRIIFNYDSKIGKTPFYTILNSKYSQGSDVNGKFSELLEDLEIGYISENDLKIYARGKYVDLRGTSLNNIDRIENHISFGVHYPLDTRIAIKGAGSISGYVFKDFNKDGMYSSGEAAVPNAVIIINNKKYYSDNNGKYIIKNVKAGEAKILLDPASIDQKYLLTSQNPKVVYIKQNKITNADFGIIANASLKGRIFRDVNNDAVFDLGDIPLSGIKIMLGGFSSVSDTDGVYIFTDLKESIYDFKIDISSIPKSIVPTIPISQKFDIREGGIYDFPIPFRNISKN